MKKERIQIEKIKINLMEKSTKQNYEAAKAKFISDYTEYVPGYSTGLFGWRNGYDKKDPVVGLAKWNEKYPLGYESWASEHMSLTGYGEQMVIDKVNELIDFVNSK